MVDESGFDSAALQRVRDALQADIDKGVIDGAVIRVARHGKVALAEALGYADRKSETRMRDDSVFKILSMTKAFTTALILEAIDLGLLSLTTRVVDIIPEFWGEDLFRSGRKERINIGHLLTHRAGLSPTPRPLPYERTHRMDDTIAAICALDAVGDPGETFNYSPAINHALLGEIVRRVHGAAGRSIGEVFKERLFDKLEMTSTSIGPGPQNKERLVPMYSCIPEGGWLTNADVDAVSRAIESPGSEMTWVGGFSTANDVFNFAEMLRQHGTYGGHRIVSPALLRKATRLQTGDAINNLYKLLADARHWDVPPGNMGLGFALGGAGLTVSQFGLHTSPGTFGGFGAGSTLFWVDPDSQITFVCLTAKLLEESENIVRFQRLSDLVASAAL